MLDVTLSSDVKVTYCTNSIRVTVGEYHFFHPIKLVRCVGHITLLYTEDWKFKLIKSEKQGEKWVDINIIECVGKEIEKYVITTVIHKPLPLDPLDYVEIPKDLLDE